MSEENSHANGREETRFVDGLVARCNTLIHELDEFRQYLQQTKNVSQTGGDVVEVRQFRSAVLSELKSLERISHIDQAADKTLHTLKSSNLPFYDAVWDAAKASRALVALHKRFYWDESVFGEAEGHESKRFAQVDVVSEDGEEWIKVSTITQQRLLFEFAKAQWEDAESSGSEDDEEEKAKSFKMTMDRIELIRTVDGLMKASRAHRVRYKNPRVRIILPKMTDPPPIGLLPLFDRIHSSGAILKLGEQIPSVPSAEQNLQDSFTRLLPSPHPPLTDTLNIDCTILLALVSDLSHSSSLPILPGYNSAIKRQIELETQDHLLPTGLYPAMEGKKLVCTQEAVDRMQEIVNTIGTPNERTRTALIVPGSDSSPTGETLNSQLSALSDYPVPSTIRLPIVTVQAPINLEITSAISNKLLPPVAAHISEGLTAINRSVFMYGWLQGITTVSSNRGVAKWIESEVEKSIVQSGTTKKSKKKRGKKDHSENEHESAKSKENAVKDEHKQQLANHTHEHHPTNHDTSANGTLNATGEKDTIPIIGPDIWVREPARSLLGKEKVRRK